MEHRDEAVRQSRRSDEARVSVDEWAVRPRTVPPCRRHPAHAVRNIDTDGRRYRRVVCVREIDHTHGEVDRTDRG